MGPMKLQGVFGWFGAMVLGLATTLPAAADCYHEVVQRVALTKQASVQLQCHIQRYYQHTREFCALNSKACQLQQHAEQLGCLIVQQAAPCELRRLAERAECLADNLADLVEDVDSCHVPKPIRKSTLSLLCSLENTFDWLEDNLEDFHYPVAAPVCGRPGWSVRIVEPVVVPSPYEPAYPVAPAPSIGYPNGPVAVPAVPAYPNGYPLDPGYTARRVYPQDHYNDRYPNIFDNRFDGRRDSYPQPLRPAGGIVPPLQDPRELHGYGHDHDQRFDRDRTRISVQLGKVRIRYSD